MVSWPRFGIFRPTEGAWFKKLAQKSFESVDEDKNGKLDRKELYIALLKMYDMMNDSLPCHMEVPQWPEIDQHMAEFDKDTSGGLEFEEYLELCKALCCAKKHWRKSIPLRVVCAVGLKLAAIPLCGWGLKKGISAIPGISSKFVPRGLMEIVAEKGYKAAGGGII